MVLSWLLKARYSCLALGVTRIASFRSGCGPPGAQKARRKWLETLKKTGDVYQAGKKLVTFTNPERKKMVTFTRTSQQRAERSTKAVVFAFCRRPCIAVWKHQSCTATFSRQRQTLFQGFYCTWKRIVEALQLRRPATIPAAHNGKSKLRPSFSA